MLIDDVYLATSDSMQGYWISVISGLVVLNLNSEWSGSSTIFEVTPGPIWDLWSVYCDCSAWPPGA